MIKKFVLDKLIDLVVIALPLLMDNMSDPMRIEIINFVNKLEERAKETKNRFDDFLVKLLKIVLDIE